MKAPIVQAHHITYDPPRIVWVTKGEHKILTLCQWYTKARVSKGFIVALRQFVKDNAGRAIDLEVKNG